MSRDAAPFAFLAEARARGVAGALVAISGIDGGAPKALGTHMAVLADGSHLNHDGIPAPRGPVWSASTLIGNASRGHGVLVNPIYSGKVVWNRVRNDQESRHQKARVSQERAGRLRSLGSAEP